MTRGKELFNAFMDKRKQQHLFSFREKKLNKKQDVVITIPLRGGSGPTGKLDESFIKVIQNEYAIRYLEQLGLMPTQANIEHVLE